MKTKRMELADGWYPKDRQQCEQRILQFIEEYNTYEAGNWLGGIVPHAGWYYSGKLACQTINLLKQTQADCLVLFGGHLRENDFITFYDYDLFETPFGHITRHNALSEAILDELSQSIVEDHSNDNSVEIVLPFIKYFFPDIPIVVFRSPPSYLAIELGKTLAENGKELGLRLLFLGSSDLTHYGPNYRFTSKGTGEKAVQWVKEHNDREFIRLLQNMEGDLAIRHSIEHFSACSGGAAVSCLTASQIYRGKTSGKIVDYYTSYDIRKDSSFVGYLGMLF